MPPAELPPAGSGADSPAAGPPLAGPAATCRGPSCSGEIDVLLCSSCGGRMRILATLTEARSIASFLRSLGVSSEAPRFALARSPPPVLDLDFA